MGSPGKGVRFRNYSYIFRWQINHGEARQFGMVLWDGKSNVGIMSTLRGATQVRQFNFRPWRRIWSVTCVILISSVFWHLLVTFVHMGATVLFFFHMLEQTNWSLCASDPTVGTKALLIGNVLLATGEISRMQDYWYKLRSTFTKDLRAGIKVNVWVLYFRDHPAWKTNFPDSWPSISRISLSTLLFLYNNLEKVERCAAWKH